MKQHLKRLAAPATWDIARKEETYMIRPLPGGSPMKFSLPLATALRMLKIANTLKEVKHILSSALIQVDGKVRKDPKFPVGFLSVLSIASEEKHYRMTLLAKGSLAFIAAPAAECALKVASVVNIWKKKGQYVHHLSDGRNVTSTKKLASTASSILFKIPSQEVQDILPLQKGATVFLIAGKHPATKGTVKELNETTVVVHAEHQTFSVSKRSVLVIGKEKQAINV